MEANQKDKNIAALSTWLGSRMAKHPNCPPTESLRALAEAAAGVIESSYARPKALRPSKVREQLRSVERHYRKATKALDAVGEDGMLMILAASGANRPSEGDVLTHVNYLHRMADLTAKALDLATEHSISQEDGKGGLRADERLERVALLLAQLYQEILALRPTYTIHPETSVGVSDFAMFVKEALRQFVSADVMPNPSAIDKAIHWATVRATSGPVESDPPPLFEAVSKST